MVRQLGDEDFYKALGLTGRSVVVLAYASWCGDSRRILPVFERISNTAEFRDVAFVQVEMEANPTAKKHLGVERYPTLYLFKNGEKVAEKIAEVSAKEQEELIMELCFSTAVMI
jgi:thioredoxin 1